MILFSYSAKNPSPQITLHFLPFAAQTYAPITPGDIEGMAPVLPVSANDADQILRLLATRQAAETDLKTFDEQKTRLLVKWKPQGAASRKVFVDYKGHILDSAFPGSYILPGPQLKALDALLTRLHQVQRSREDRQARFKPELVAAAERNQTTKVAALLARGADPNTRSGVRETALMWAAKNGNIALCRLLLARGANMNAAVQGGSTAITYSVLGNKPAALQFLLTHGAPMRSSGVKNALYEAASEGREGMVKAMLRAGADPNAADKEGRMPLLGAAAGGHIAIVRHLLASGAEVDRQGSEYGTALFMAGLIGNEEMLRLLVDHGANVNLDTGAGYTPLVSAIEGKKPGLVKFLLVRGALVDPRALEVARKVSNPEILKLIEQASRQ